MIKKSKFLDNYSKKSGGALYIYNDFRVLLDSNNFTKNYAV